MSTYLITAINKGIGFEFAKQLGAKSENTIIGTVRREADLTAINSLEYTNIKLLYIDMKDPLGKFVGVFSDLEALSPNGIDVIIHNAGAGGLDAMKPLQDQPIEFYEEVININALGSVKLYKAIYPRLEKNGKPFKFVFISSAVGMISNMQFTGGGYGMSKAAINYFAKQMSLERKDKCDTIIAVHPGMVDTDLSAPFKAFDFYNPISPTESVSSLLNIIDRVGIEDSGKFFNYGGEVLNY